MKQIHLFNDHIYEIHSHAVARNPIFVDTRICRRFLEKIEKYLTPLCEVLHYTFHENQFRLVIKMKSREAFVAFEQLNKGGIEEEEIGFTTHIFSQAMANLLSSMALHFNRKHGRTGALFARRFFRRLIESKKDLEFVIESMNRMECLHKYRKNWRVRSKKKKKHNKKGRRGWESWELSAINFYRRVEFKIHPVLSNFIRVKDIELRGHFKNLPPSSIYDKYSKFTFNFLVKKDP